MDKNCKHKSSLFNKVFRACSFLSFLVSLSLIWSTSSYGIKLTKVRPLFDITHKFSQPSDLSVSVNGSIYIVDGVKNKIKVFHENGKYAFSFGKKGTGRGEFILPLGIDIDSSGRVYIADSGNHRVQVFTANGSFIKEIKVPQKDGIMSDPVDVAVDESRGRCYVVDNNNHYILVYDLSTLKVIKTYGKPGMEKREFRYPFLIALDRDKYLYIVDVINTRVQVLNPGGLFVTYIGGWGVKKGQFFRPKGITVDKNQRVYVSDSYMGVIQVFEANGEFHSAIGDYRSGRVKKFTTPVGIFVDRNNRLYVVEMFAEKVSVYSIGNSDE